MPWQTRELELGVGLVRKLWALLCQATAATGEHKSQADWAELSCSTHGYAQEPDVMQDALG